MHHRVRSLHSTFNFSHRIQKPDASSHLQHIETSQIGFQGVTHEDHKQLKIHKLYEHRPIDKSHYMMTWFGELDGGGPIVAHFFGPTVLYAIEGT